MATIYLVRHGKAAAGWDADPDPGLHADGVAQAQAVAGRLAARTGPIEVFSSPLRRARETAAPLAERWGSDVRILPAIGEIPSPTADLVERTDWLAGALRGRWANLGGAVAAWRRDLLSAVAAAGASGANVVWFTHFVAINAMVGAATDRPEVTVFLPANASVTEVQVDAASGTWRVASLGLEASPEVG